MDDLKFIAIKKPKQLNLQVKYDELRNKDRKKRA